jgi:hypothetical protein
MYPRAKRKIMPEVMSADVRIHVVMRIDMLVWSTTARHFDNVRRLDRSWDDIRVYMADASMIGAIH